MKAALYGGDEEKVNVAYYGCKIDKESPARCSWYSVKKEGACL